MTVGQSDSANPDSNSDPEFFDVSLGWFQNFPPIDVGPEVDEIANSFAALGARRGEPWQVPVEERNRDAIRARMQSWVASKSPGTIFYWLGHGVSNNKESGLAYTTSPTNLADQFDLVGPRDLANWLNARDRDEANRDHWALILVDACQSARFIQQVSAQLDELGGPRRVLLLASSPQQASAALGQLRKAIRTATDFRIKEPRVDLIDFARDILRALNPPGEQVVGEMVIKRVNDVTLANRRALPSGMQATVDAAQHVADFLQDLPEREREHFRLSASGSEFGSTAWYFTGRGGELREVCHWLDGTGSMLVVTGTPGSGKSALLGNILLRSNPELWRTLGPNLEEKTADEIHVPPIHCAVKLTGSTAEHLIDSIAAQLEFDEPPSLSNFEARIGWLTTLLESRPIKPVILLDALDESQDVIGVATIARRLAHSDRARVIVGTRRSTKSEWGFVEPDESDIIARLGSADAMQVLELERSETALAAYVEWRLRDATNAGVLGLQIDSVTDRLRRAPDFLLARLALTELVADPSLTHGNWLDEALQAGPSRVFEQAVHRLTSINANYGPLLQALAARRGRGLPAADGVWLAVASGLADQSEQPRVGDLTELLADAATYILVDSEFGRTVYRIAHRVCEETVPSVLGPASPAPHLLRIVQTLTHLADEPSTPIPPYVRFYMADHARVGGQAAWQRLTEHPRLLADLDTNSVVVAALRTDFAGEPIPTLIAAILAARHTLTSATSDDAPGIRQIAAARFAGDHDTGRAGFPDGGKWSLRAAHMDRRYPHILLTEVGGAGIRSLAAYTDTDGALRLLAGTTTGVTQIWDPITGVVVGEMTGHVNSVRAIAVIGTQREPVVITAGEDGRLIRWDQLRRTPVNSVETGSPIWALVSFGTPGDEIVVSGAKDGSIRTWGPDLSPRESPTAMRRWVSALAKVDDGILAAGDDTGVVRFINMNSNEDIDIAELDQGVRALAAASSPEGPRVLALTVGARGWVLAPGTDPKPLWEKQIRSRTAAEFAVDDRPMLAVADRASMLVVDNATLDVQATLVGHTRPIRTVIALPDTSDSLVLATGSEDGTVRCWPYPFGARSGHEEADLGEIISIATVHHADSVLLAAARAGGTINLFDQDLQQLDAVSVGNPVNGLAVQRLADVDRLVIATIDGTFAYQPHGKVDRYAPQPNAQHVVAADVDQAIITAQGGKVVADYLGGSRLNWSLPGAVTDLVPVCRHGADPGASADSRFIAAAVVNHREVWGLKANERKRIHRNDKRITALAAWESPAKTVAVIAGGAIVRQIFVHPKGTEFTVADVHEDNVRAMIAFEDENGPRLITGDVRGRIVIWNAESRLAQLHRIEVGVPVLSLGMFDGGWAVGTPDGLVLLDVDF